MHGNFVGINSVFTFSLFNKWITLAGVFYLIIFALQIVTPSLPDITPKNVTEFCNKQVCSKVMLQIKK